MPRWIQPALAALAEKPFSDPGWLFEIKWDGVRALAEIRNGRTTLWARSHRDISREYPEFSNLASAVDAREAWLDGEIVVLDDSGRSDFQRLQMRFGVQNPSSDLMREAPAVYYAFDLLYLDGRDLRQVPLVERKRLLREILRDSDRLRYSDHVAGKGNELFHLSAERNLEGIVAKRAGAAYPSGRTSAWLKIKREHELDAVVGGWTDPRGARQYFGALLVGGFDRGKLRFIGGVGSGFDFDAQRMFWPQLRKLHVSRSPFAHPPATRERAHWVRPELVVRVRYSNWTEDLHLRAPRFLGLQPDRSARDITLREERHPPTARHSPNPEEPMPGNSSSPKAAGAPRPAPRTGRQSADLAEAHRLGSKAAGNAHPALNPPAAIYHTGRAESGLASHAEIERELARGSAENIFAEIDGHRLRLTHLNKVYFPGERYTKRALLHYYFRHGDLLLPYLRDRPMVLRRYPDGIAGDSFFQKDAAKQTPDWIRTVPVDSSTEPERSGGRMRKPHGSGVIHYILANDLATLIYLTNLGCIDHNPWSSRYNHADHPDYAFFDLDPTPGTPVAIVAELARWLVAELTDHGFRPFLKTSGATGLHIYLPLEPVYTYEQVRLFVEAIASQADHKRPGLITFERSLRKRPPGRVYVDAHQNSRGQSLASVYSVRAFPHAPVSAPIRVEELDSRSAARARKSEGFDPARWDLRTMARRLEEAGDLWQDFWSTRQRLETVLRERSGR